MRHGLASALDVAFARIEARLASDYSASDEGRLHQAWKNALAELVGDTRTYRETVEADMLSRHHPHLRLLRHEPSVVRATGPEAPVASGRLISACRNGQLIEVRELMEADEEADGVDGYGLSGLMYAARNGHAAVVELLLSCGWTADARDRTGRSALHHACAFGRLICARILLDAGADINAKDLQSCTPLFLTEVDERRNDALIELLVSRGATACR